MEELNKEQPKVIAVNKKKKELDKKISAFVDEYQFIDTDKNGLKKWREKQDELYHLQKCADYEGKKALSNFNDLEKTKGSSRQNKAGIIFPPYIMEKFLRNFGNSKLMVTSTAPIFFAAAIEYITAEILDLASISSKDFKRVRITIRDLELAIRNDEELDSLFTKLNISLFLTLLFEDI